MGPEGTLVLIADDDAAFRRVLRGLLAGEPDLEVVAEAADGEEAIALVSEHVPHVVLMDIRMPSLDGIQAARVLGEIHPSTKVVILTVSDEAADLFEAIKAGASAYILKDGSLADIASVVREVRLGNPTLSPVMASKLLAEFASMAQRERTASTRPQLTKRELLVLRHIAHGLTTQDVGEKLGMSENAVKRHVRNLVEKFHIYARIQSVMTTRPGERSA